MVRDVLGQVETFLKDANNTRRLISQGKSNKNPTNNEQATRSAIKYEKLPTL